MQQDNFKTIESYFNETSRFVIPFYQRGFKWGTPTWSENKCSVEILIGDLLKAFNSNSDKEYFLQGVTVDENITTTHKVVELIDGQQRTTSVFLLLCYLRCRLLNNANNNGKSLSIHISNLIKKNNDIILEYKVRKESQIFLNKISLITNIESLIETVNKKEKIDQEDFQDVFYFKKAIQTIHNKFEHESRIEEFTRYLLFKVQLIYIIIEPEKAINAFTMLNSQKAVMTDEELIKAELLSKSSRAVVKHSSLTSDESITDEKSKISREWEIDHTRSKYAREWDKWLYWWNREDVKDFFGIQNSMGLLLQIYFELNSDLKSSYSFDSFSRIFLYNKQKAKKTFIELRHLQKTFEDWYNDPVSYNYLWILIHALRSAYSPKTHNYKKALLFLINKKIDNNLTFSEIIQIYARFALIGGTNSECEQLILTKEISEPLAKKIIAIKDLLSSCYVYADEMDNEQDYYNSRQHAYNQLLRINVEKENELERKFDFSIWNNKSLEHIHPKSKKDELNFSKMSDSLSVHCIGNLVLLYFNDNASFNDSKFPRKKELFFKDEKLRKSLTLLHTVSVFSEEKWNEDTIEANQKSFLNNYNLCYAAFNK